MSNNIRQDLKNNSVFDLFNGSAPQPINEIEQVKTIEVKPIKETDNKPSVSDVKPKPIKKDNPKDKEPKDKYKYKKVNKEGNLTKEGNYTITFKIDADIEQYLKHIDKITFIDVLEGKATESQDATNYVNELIRADLKRRLKLADNEQDFNKWVNGYKELAKKYKLDDK